MRGDIYNYEDLIFELVEVELKKWSVQELKLFLDKLEKCFEKRN